MPICFSSWRREAGRFTDCVFCRYERGAQNYAQVERVTQTAFGPVHMISFERMVGNMIGLLNGMQGRTAHHLQLQAR